MRRYCLKVKCNQRNVSVEYSENYSSTHSRGGYMYLGTDEVLCCRLASSAVSSCQFLDIFLWPSSISLKLILVLWDERVCLVCLVCSV